MVRAGFPTITELDRGQRHIGGECRVAGVKGVHVTYRIEPYYSIIPLLFYGGGYSFTHYLRNILGGFHS